MGNNDDINIKGGKITLKGNLTNKQEHATLLNKARRSAKKHKDYVKSHTIYVVPIGRGTLLEVEESKFIKNEEKYRRIASSKIYKK